MREQVDNQNIIEIGALSSSTGGQNPTSPSLSKRKPGP